MIGYVTLGSNDLAKAASFYDEVLKEINATRIYDTEGFISWGVDPASPMLGILPPHDGNPATVGNGVMIAIKAENRDTVDKLHAKALALGAVNEGDPGVRGGGFYCAYFRDMDGNKLNAFCIESG